MLRVIAPPPAARETLARESSRFGPHAGSRLSNLDAPDSVVLSDGQEHAVEDLRTELASEFELSESDLEERLPSGRAKTFNNRVGWATTYLYRCGLVARPRRSIYVITERGREVLEQNQQRVDLSVLVTSVVAPDVLIGGTGSLRARRNFFNSSNWLTAGDGITSSLRFIAPPRAPFPDG